MNDQIIGFVLKTVEYKEKDRIITLFSEKGKITFLAKGVQKLNSKNAASLQLFTKVNVCYNAKEERNMQQLMQAKTVMFYRHLYNDLQLSSMANILVDILDRLAVNNDSHILFSILEQSFQLWEQNADSNLVFMLALSSLLQLFGFCPNVDSCVHCDSRKVVYFSSLQGGFLCAEHSNYQQLKIEQLKRLRIAFKAKMEQYEALKDKVFFDQKDIAYALAMFKEHADLNLKSIYFYEHLFL